jgi:hypothetical protein
MQLRRSTHQGTRRLRARGQRTAIKGTFYVHSQLITHEKNYGRRASPKKVIAHQLVLVVVDSSFVSQAIHVLPVCVSSRVMLRAKPGVPFTI